jgi:Rps23 Pro-64 3,4-dihydroxylase Tpa1-like proline 4-hydroxylase
VPACQGTLKAVNHIAPNIQSAMPAKTTAPQFNRIVFAPPEYARRQYPVPGV